MMEVSEREGPNPQQKHLSHTSITKTQPWVEKYRPKSVDDISHQDEVVKTLKTAIQTGMMPHLLFYGPPGTGKTSTILAVARTLFGPDIYKSRTLELNASDERGIVVVREKVKSFAQQSAVSSSVHPRDQSSCPPFKLIILDEADTMTADAQSALRRMMEIYSKNTRFCLICNYVTRIIEPLASRCAKFRFRALSRPAMLEKLCSIAEAEQVTVSSETLDGVVDLADGDLRKAVTALQSIHQLYGRQGGDVSKSELAEVTGKIPPPAIEAVWEGIKSNVFWKLQLTIETFMCEGFPAVALLTQLMNDVVNNEAIPDNGKAIISEKLAEADKLLIDGAHEHIQLLNAAAVIMRVLHNTSEAVH